jgi:hypothetical protein
VSKLSRRQLMQRYWSECFSYWYIDYSYWRECFSYWYIDYSGVFTKKFSCSKYDVSFNRSKVNVKLMITNIRLRWCAENRWIRANAQSCFDVRLVASISQTTLGVRHNAIRHGGAVRIRCLLPALIVFRSIESRCARR